VVVPVLFIALGLLGMGNGAVFQLVPQRFAERIGIITGIVGAAGGLGGFFLPSILGLSRDATGSYRLGLLMFAALFFAGTLALVELGARWSRRWEPQAVKQSGIFCYRLAMRRLLGEETI
jgi:NNP family nitrate/nitrite transporter-like MFS transporter